MKLDKKTIIMLIILIALSLIINFFGNDYVKTIANLCGIYVTLGLSMQLINGLLACSPWGMQDSWQ